MIREDSRQPDGGSDDLRGRILRTLSRSPRGMTARRLGRKAGAPAYVVQKTLLGLQKDGKVTLRGGTRWYANAPVVDPAGGAGRLPEEALGAADQRAPGRGRADTPSTESSLSRYTGASRWKDFRNLCLYYAECIRLESRADVKAYAEDEGSKFISLRGEYDWRGISAGGQLALQPPKDWGDFVRRLKHRRRTPRLFVGLPVDLFIWRDSKSGEQVRFVSPIFVVQVDHLMEDGMLHLNAVSPVEINHGWLQRRWPRHDDRNAFLELCGVEVSDKYDEQEASEACSPGFDELVSGLWRHYRNLWQEPADLKRLQAEPALESVEISGIYNRAVLMSQQGLKYTEGLYQELLHLARETEDEELDKSALTVLFPHEPPKQPAEAQEPETEEDTAAESERVAELHHLNDNQRHACEVAREAPCSLVIGPPGTGKSRVVAATVADAVIQGKSVLFSSRNHQALEAVVPRLNAVTEPNMAMVRMSHPPGDTGADPLARMLETLFDQPAPDAAEAEFTAGLERLTRLLQQFADNRDRVSRIHDLHAEMETAEQDLGDLLREFPEECESLVWEPKALPGSEEIDSLLRVLDDRTGDEPNWLLRFLARLVRWWRLRKVLPQAREVDGQYAEAFAAVFGARAEPGTENTRELAERLHRWKTLALARETAGRIAGLHRTLGSMPKLAQCYERFEELIARIPEETQACLRQRTWVASSKLEGEDRQKLAEVRAGLENYGRLETDQSKEFRKAVRQAHSILLKYMPAWATTNLRARYLPSVPGGFDLLIIDEATQCDIASVVPLLYRARRAMVVGDPMQLKHVSTLKRDTESRLRRRFGLNETRWERYTYSNNSFLRLVDGSAAVPGEHRVRLLDHHRSHPLIAGYCNRAFYTDTLRIMTQTEALSVPPGFDAHRGGLRWTHVPADAEQVSGSGHVSQRQIEAILEELRRLLEDRFSGTVGVVTLFKAQKNRIQDRVERELSGQLPQGWRFLVDTADGYQGDERDVMLLSLVGGPEMPRGAKWFLSTSPNRFNVAVSRARAALHVFGDEEWAKACGISHVEALWRAVQEQNQRTEEVTRSDLIGPVWEPRLAEALREADLPFEQQYPACGRYLDFALVRDGLKLDVEVDGEAYHRDASGRRKIEDLERDLVLVANGWKILRFWVYELREDMDACVEEVKRIWLGESTGKERGKP